MNVYATDHDRVEFLRNNFKKYGKYIIAVLLLIVAYIVVVNYLDTSNTKEREHASQLFDSLINAAEQEKVQLANEIVSKYPVTVYAKMAQMFLAQQDVAQAKEQDALAKYKDVYEKTQNWGMLHLLSFRNMIVLQAKLDGAKVAYEHFLEKKERFRKYPLITLQLEAYLLNKLGKVKEADAAYEKLLALQHQEIEPELKPFFEQYFDLVKLEQGFTVKS